MQTRVKDTKMQKAPLWDGHGERTRSEVLVADGHLVLVCPDQDVFNTLTSHAKLATSFKEHSIETGINYIGVDLWWKRSETKLLGIPLIISLTEEIEEGDLRFNTNNNADNHLGFRPMMEGDTDIESKRRGWVKILALPEHFSPKHLQDIVDGKLKEGKVAVECELYQDTINYHKDIWHNFHRIKLNQSNHITLHKVEEKMLYTREEMIKNAFDFYYDLSNQMKVPFNLITENRDHAKTWFEINIK